MQHSAKSELVNMYNNTTVEKKNKTVASKHSNH